MMLTGNPWVDGVLVASAFVIALATIYAKVIKPILAFRDRAVDFLDDWTGRPATPTRKRQPGVMERLEQLEHNGGQSLKDHAARAHFAAVEAATTAREVRGELQRHMTSSDQVQLEMWRAIRELTAATPAETEEQTDG